MGARLERSTLIGEEPFDVEDSSIPSSDLRAREENQQSVDLNSEL